MKQILMLVFMMLFSNIILSQDFQGIATYKSQRKSVIKLDSTQISSKSMEQLTMMMNRQNTKTFKLVFNKTESLYKEEKELESPQQAGIKMSIVGASTGSGILYKNFKERRYINQKESLGKMFLIKDLLQKYNWNITGEVKFIGQYKCYKAVMKREAKDQRAQKETVIEIVAWYTPEIPINSGPNSYHGLPGLILEINDGISTIVCNKVILSPEKKIKIIKPKKGKVISQLEHDKIIDKKSKEMKKRVRSGAETIKIRIGG